MESDDSKKAPINIGNEQITGDLLWEANFSDPERFRVEVESGTVEFQDEELVVDCRENADGATVWAKREFPEDVLVEYKATCHEDGERDEMTSGRNLNLFFAATGADGDAGSLAEAELSGDYSEYHGLPNYIFTFTLYWSRMRRDPGFDMRSEFAIGSQPNHSYDIRVLKQGGDIAASIDGRLVHDWSDPEPHGSGQIGVRTWNSHLTVDEWAVYELK